MAVTDFLCRAETRRVLWVMGGVFAFSILFQFCELPYGNFIGSLFSGLNFNRMNYVNTQINFTGGFDEKISRNDSIFSIESKKSGGNHSYDSSGVELLKPNTNLAPERAMEFGNIFKGNNGNVAPMLDEKNKDDNIVPIASDIESPPLISSPPRVDDNLIAPIATQIDEVTVIVVPLNSTDATTQLMNSPAPSVSHRHVDTDNSTALASPHNPNEATGLVRNDHALSGNGSTMTKSTPAARKASVEGVVSISEMTNMLLRSSHPSNLLTNPAWSSAGDEVLLSAKSQIESAANNISDPGLYAPVYHNVSKFKRSYELMEQNLKIYIYKEGKRPIFHQPKLKGIYASEGWFMKQLKESKQFLTDDPNKAHLFYLPFSSQTLEEVVYVPGSRSFDKLKAFLNNYLDLIKGRYPFWNRTQGADHFLVACHDWAPEETRREMANCIKSLCNADLREGFKFGKDVSLPETNIVSTNPSRSLGGNRPSQRKFLAFFAGSMHGYVRPILLKHWQNKDPMMKIFGRMDNHDYILHMKSSKYCICARGHEVNSPRVVESISYQCVPVIISDNFVPPFLETLNWETFAVFVQEKDIPNLKSILESIPLRRYLKLYNNVMKVQQHFLWHPEPVKYDTFYMILHSIWYNRVFQIAS
ncbi:probable glycosyltransferase At5g03795 [Solanum stenotomum]|uniref:probable glycosyltransferase At5g03795 n=1 Tax=Solanum stenotomum TaxID=172797 RepID=UPI0020D0B9C7|nr:probable glycosyltransferase At5g03795 [Solanum stenotomum]